MVHAPGFVQGREHVALNHLVANETQVPEQLVVMRFAVSQSLLLVVTMTQERLFALRTHKVLHMPVPSHRLHDPLLNGTMTGAADRNPHLVVTTQAVQLVLYFTRLCC